jgi:hypothetical protein
MRALVFLVASPTCVAGIAAAPRLLTARNVRAMPKGLLQPFQMRTLMRRVGTARQPRLPREAGVSLRTVGCTWRHEGRSGRVGWCVSVFRLAGVRTVAALACWGGMFFAPTVLGELAAEGSVLRVQLDRDAPLEKLVTKRVSAEDCGAPTACSRLLLVDGQRRVALSTIRQRGEPSNYRWRIASVRPVDLTGDGIRDVMWKQETVGATASSPVLFAVSRWNGRRAEKVFTLRIRRRPAAGYYASIPLSVRIKRNAGARELWTTEGLYRAGDGDCCPSALRHRRYRWNGRRIALVPGSTRVVPTSTS